MGLFAQMALIVIAFVALVALFARFSGVIVSGLASLFRWLMDKTIAGIRWCLTALFTRIKHNFRSLMDDYRRGG